MLLDLTLLFLFWSDLKFFFSGQILNFSFFTINLVCKIHDIYFFRPPFINGRPQDSDSVFWKKAIVPFFEVKAPLFSFTSFSFTSFVRGHQESPGVTRGHQGSPGITRGRPGETGSALLGTARHCSALLGTARRCSALLGTARHCSALLGTARHCSALLGTARHCSALLGTARHCS